MSNKGDEGADSKVARRHPSISSPSYPKKKVSCHHVDAERPLKRAEEADFSKIPRDVRTGSQATRKQDGGTR